MSTALIFPGSFALVKKYGGYEGWDVWVKPYPQELPTVDYYIGHSAGVHFILSRYKVSQRGKLIFINPEIRKRNPLSIIASFIRVSSTEHILAKRRNVTPIRSWLFGINALHEISKVDVLQRML